MYVVTENYILLHHSCNQHPPLAAYSCHPRCVNTQTNGLQRLPFIDAAEDFDGHVSYRQIGFAGSQLPDECRKIDSSETPCFNHQLQYSIEVSKVDFSISGRRLTSVARWLPVGLGESVHLGAMGSPGGAWPP